MPRHCSAGGCKSRDNRDTRNAGITFHKLPKGETRRNLWITNSHRADPWDPQTDFVYFCSKHFTPDSFELTGSSGIRRLKEDAFPTVFDSSSKTRCKRAGALQKQEDNPVGKNSCSNEENTQHTDKDQTSEELADQRSAAAAERTNENTPASSRGPSGLEQLSQLARSPPWAHCRPLSPSCYMRRLPPPPGFYLSKEHSYAQLCPLLWRRRYNQAIDCLEKALRQLHAARRRENRLRGAVLRLREKRLKQTLLVSPDSCKNRGSWRSAVERRQAKGGCSQERSDTGPKTEDTGVFEDRYMDQIELGGCFLPDTNSWSDDENGYCFYCGRGQMQVDAEGACSSSKNGNESQPKVHEYSIKIQRRIETTCSTAENVNDMQIVRLDGPPGKVIQITDPDVTHSKVLLQTQVPQQVIPTGVSLTDVHERCVQGSQQKLLLSDVCEGETEDIGQEHPLDPPQQLFWIQDSAEKQLILVPVSAEDGLQSILHMEGVTDDAQTILDSEVGHMRGNSGGLSRAEADCDGEHSVINTTAVEMKDVREKLKEHLEGFHLQLSTQFLN